MCYSGLFPPSRSNLSTQWKQPFQTLEAGFHPLDEQTVEKVKDEGSVSEYKKKKADPQVSLYSLLRHQEHRDAPRRLSSHHQDLCNIGSLRRAADERAVAIVLFIEFYAFVGLMHIVHNLTLRQ